MTPANVALNGIAEVLRTIPLLSTLSTEELIKMVDSLEVCRFSAGQNVITDGDVSQDMFIVESGSAVCTKIGESGSLYVRFRARLTRVCVS